MPYVRMSHTEIPSDEPKPRKLSMGRLAVTSGVSQRMRDPRYNAWTLICLGRHSRGDWGDLSDEDKAVNEEAIKNGFRLLSAYKYQADDVLWIITEADRRTTTLLLPSEY